MQHCLKAAARAAGAQVVATELLLQELVAVDHAPAALDVALGREAAAALTGALESGKGLRGTVAGLWDTSFDITEPSTHRGQNGASSLPGGSVCLRCGVFPRLKCYRATYSSLI